MNIVLPTEQAGAMTFQSTDIFRGYASSLSCLQIMDSDFANTKPVTCEKVNFNWEQLTSTDLAFDMTNQPPDGDSFAITKTEICKQQSICNNLIIHGNSSVCLDSSAISFSGSKDLLCLSEIIWSIDTSFIANKAIINDTTVQLTFKKIGTAVLYGKLEGCGITDSITLAISEIGKIHIGGDTILCPQSLDTLTVYGSYQSYQWQDGSQDSNYVVRKPGKYYVEAYNQCGISMSDTISIIFDSIKIIDPFEISVCKGQDTLISAKPGFSNYSWQPISAIPGNPSSQAVDIRAEHSMTVSVSGKSSFGCEIKDSVYISTINCLTKFHMPNAFTPNGDGKNDLICPVLNGNVVTYEFSIYDRWGQIVFHSTKQGLGWDGRMSGQYLNSSAFIWTCKFQFLGESPQLEKGSFVLIH